MLIQRAADILSSEITSESVYRNRREFIKAASLLVVSSKYDTDEKVTPYNDATTYNNYYEFGSDKSEPAKNATSFKTKPWTVAVDGMVKKPAMYDLDDLMKGLAVEDRLYRMRCVEAWSMVIPWRGFPLADLIKRLEPLPSARFIEFKTVVAKEQMPGQRNRFLGGGLTFPYKEGLRLDEAMHPLTLIATGVYGKPLPNQNGAPWRLVVPWKYGFKGIKAIVSISFLEKQPISSWMEQWPQAYGFYANVNPSVEHPRWSQAREQRLDGTRSIFSGGSVRRTLMFNGYADQVASLYSGMDLRKNY